MDFQRTDFGLFRTLVERVPWEKVLKGKGVRECWTFFKEDVTATGAGCSHVPRDERVGKTTGLAEQSVFLGLRKKRRVYHFWKKGWATQEEYRGLVRSCRGEIRKAKGQLELRLATVVGDNKECFYKCINKEKRAQEKLSP